MLKTRLLAVLLLLPFIFNGSTFASVKNTPKATPPAPQDVSIEGRILDERAQILSAYLTRHNSPLESSAQNFIDAADRYNLDWRLVAAISGTESTFGKATPGGYNAWGWGVYGNQALRFNSWKDAIYAVSAGLRNNYYNRGLTNLFAINRVYASSGHWAYSVNFFMDDIDRFQQEYYRQRLAKVAGTTAFLAQN